MDITQLILDDHHEQRRLFAILEQMDPGDAGAPGTGWAGLAGSLGVHAAAGGTMFYPDPPRAGGWRAAREREGRSNAKVLRCWWRESGRPKPSGPSVT